MHRVGRSEVVGYQHRRPFGGWIASMLAAQMTEQVLFDVLDVLRAFSEVRGGVFEKRFLETLYDP